MFIITVLSTLIWYEFPINLYLEYNLCIIIPVFLAGIVAIIKECGTFNVKKSYQTIRNECIKNVVFKLFLCPNCSIDIRGFNNQSGAIIF